MKVLCSQGFVSPHLCGSSPIRSLERRLHPRHHGVCPGSWLHKGGQERIVGSKVIDFYALSWGYSSEASMKFGRNGTTEKSASFTRSRRRFRLWFRVHLS